MVNRQPVSLILNSAHGKYPIGSEPWIQKTVCAVQSLAEEQTKMLCSTEPVMWNLVTALASRSGMEIILIVKAHDDSKGHREFQKIMDEYALDENRTSPLYLGEDAVNQPKKLWRSRDRLALRTADIVYPVSIRPGGRLETMLLKGEVNAKVRNDFRISRSHESHPVKIPVYDLSERTVNPFLENHWLVHWT